MKSRASTCVVTMTLLAALAIANGLAAQEHQQPKKETRYIITDLGTFGAAFATAQGINNKGWVDGLVADENGQQHEYVLRKGVFTDLGTLGGPNSGVGSFGQAPNERGQIVGAAETADIDPLAEGFCSFLLMSPPTGRGCRSVSRSRMAGAWY